MAVVRTPYSWLREYLPNLSAPATQVAQLLTQNGIETEVRSERGEAWEGVWVGRVTKLERHPKADKLLLATVDYGRGTKTVVTGAANLGPGDVVPYAEVGARLIEGQTGKVVALEPRTIRGVRSEGMVCSERELGLGEDHEGILVLDSALPVGTPLADALGELVLVSELRPNRSDCLGILGIAREVAALLDLPTREPLLDPLPRQAPRDFTVEVEDLVACPRYTATFVRGVRVQPSPDWLQQRLVSAGMRPINNVVDVTNYVMLETGQPLHAFDRRRLRGAAIRVRRAAPQERLVTLDGEDRALDPSVLVIADGERPVALAGIIGGADSEIADDTSDVVLEIAKFENRGIWTTSARLRVQTESGRRFSWDVSPDLVPYALRRAIRLLRELAEGEASETIDVYPEPREVPNIRLPFRAVRRLLGIELPREEILDALRRVGCRYAVNGEVVIVTPPAWRTDLTIPEDVIEEAARIIGYERIPTHLPSGPLPLPERQPLREFRERVRDALVGFGTQEIVCYPLIDPRWLEMLAPDGARVGPEPIRLSNPLSAELSVLRTTLVPSLLDTARRNLRWSLGVALFEIAPVYLPRPGDLPQERPTVAIVLSGRADADAPRHWLEGDARAFDLFDLRGLVDGVAEALSLALPEPEPSAEHLHPGRSYSLKAGERELLRAGQLDPRVAERWELPAQTFVAEADLELLAQCQQPLAVRLAPRYPSAQRDLAVVVDESASWQRVRDETRSAGGKQLVRLTLLDLYRGPQVPAGKKSFAMRLVFQSDEATLSDEEIERLVRRVVGRLQRTFEATLRE